jgi:hypothetical protein
LPENCQQFPRSDLCFAERKMTTIPQTTLRDLNNAAHAAARQAYKMGDPRLEEFRRIARETDRLMDGSAPAFATSA